MKTFFHLGIGAASKTFSCLLKKQKQQRLDALIISCLVNAESELIREHSIFKHIRIQNLRSHSPFKYLNTMADVKAETFFTQSNSPFPGPTEDEKISADEFLLASTHLANFFGFPNMQLFG
jgi:hypothetical protein